MVSQKSVGSDTEGGRTDTQDFLKLLVFRPQNHFLKMHLGRQCSENMLLELLTQFCLFIDEEGN